jgi:hypothetical protein
MQAEHEALREARYNAGEVDSDGEDAKKAAAAEAAVKAKKDTGGEWRRELATDEVALQKFKKRMAGRK